MCSRGWIRAAFHWRIRVTLLASGVFFAYGLLPWCPAISWIWSSWRYKWSRVPLWVTGSDFRNSWTVGDHAGHLVVYLHPLGHVWMTWHLNLLWCNSGDVPFSDSPGWFTRVESFMTSPLLVQPSPRFGWDFPGAVISVWKCPPHLGLESWNLQESQTTNEPYTN